MPSNLEALNKKVQSLKDKHERLEKDVRTLKDVLNVHDNWNSEIRNLIGHNVIILDVTGKQDHGVLLWSDRYNLCLKPTGREERRLYNKGSIVWLEPY